MPKGIGYPFGRAARKVAKAAGKAAALGGVAKLKKRKRLSFKDFLKIHKKKGTLTDQDMQRLRQMWKRSLKKLPTKGKKGGLLGAHRARGKGIMKR
ncbi:MAG: hypothetical protein KAJ75_06855 [Alphaproteobacteria bacterium]|nr:hypothetical protein [Alphaproteobacteria bacterium]